MKTEIHPEYVLSHVHCSCGNDFYTRSTKAELHVELCSQCHPFYTGKQKLVDTGGRVERFRRRAAKRAQRASPRGAGGPQRRSADGASDVSPAHQAERMPDGKPVASEDAPVGGQAVLEGVMMRGVSTWAVAVRNPEGEIEVTSEPIVSWAKRHRVLRLPVIRGVVALGESLKIGFRALAISANASSRRTRRASRRRSAAGCGA